MLLLRSLCPINLTAFNNLLSAYKCKHTKTENHKTIVDEISYFKRDHYIFIPNQKWLTFLM